MAIVLNRGQEDIVNKAIDWYHNSSEQIFQISGNPGTGKSVVLNSIIHKLNLKQEDVAPMAYTGAAAIVMRIKGLTNARTIHSWVYEVVEVPMLDKDLNPVMNTYFNTPMTKTIFRPKVLKGIKLIVIDEGGSVPLSMRRHILNSGAKVLVAGDLDQLPPVADSPGFLFTGEVHVLTEIMRQAEGSAIIYLSQRAKNGLPIHLGNYGNCLVISEDEVTDEMYMSSSVVLCGKNTTRDYCTTHIRNDLLGIRGPLPVHGEKLLCRKNNWGIEYGGINLTNGLTGRVANYPDVSSYDGKTFVIDFIPDVDTSLLFPGIRGDYKYLNSTKAVRDDMKKLGYTNGNLFEFGYAQTVHLAQGSQWANGMYFEEYLNPQVNNKLNFVGISRFSHMAIYVKRKRKYM